jgi:predicted dehydrogenase
MKKINWGIIGPGRIAQQFAHDIPFAASANLLAVASRTLSRAEDFAKEYGIPRAYGSYDELLNDDDIDIVYVAVPHMFHLEVSSRVLKAGKAVLCEKPLTISVEDNKQLLDLAAQHQLYLMEGMWTYFLPAIRKAQVWIDSGKIGKVRNVNCSFGWEQPLNIDDRWLNPALAGGVLWDMGCYTLAMAYKFLGTDPKTINVLCQKAETGVDKEIMLQMGYDDGTASLSSAFDDQRLGMGFEFEIESVSKDLLAGCLQSATVPHTYSTDIQEQMTLIRSKF